MAQRIYEGKVVEEIFIANAGDISGGGGGTVEEASAGPVAPGAPAAKSSLIGAVYNNSLPTLTTGVQQALQMDLRGALRVRVHATALTGSDGVSNALLAGVNGEGSVGGETRMASQAPYVFNGTTWDRQRGDAFGLRIQPAQRPGTNRSKLITTTSSEIIPASANSWFLANDSAANIIINIGAAASSTDSDTEGSFLLRPGERLSSRDVVETGAVNGIVASGTARIKARST